MATACSGWVGPGCRGCVGAVSPRRLWVFLRRWVPLHCWAPLRARAHLESRSCGLLSVGPAGPVGHNFLRQTSLPGRDSRSRGCWGSPSHRSARNCAYQRRGVVKSVPWGMQRQTACAVAKVISGTFACGPLAARLGLAIRFPILRRTTWQFVRIRARLTGHCLPEAWRFHLARHNRRHFGERQQVIIAHSLVSSLPFSPRPPHHSPRHGS